MRRKACSACGGGIVKIESNKDTTYKCTVCGAEYNSPPLVSDKVARPFSRNKKED